MSTHVDDSTVVRTRRLANPYLWTWEVVDVTGDVIESGWESSSQAFLSPAQAASAGRIHLVGRTQLRRAAELADRPSRRPSLVIVSRHDVVLYESLRASFAGDAGITVLLDRRIGERRRRQLSALGERRRRDRRVHADADGRFRSLGWFMVLPDAEGGASRRG